LKIKYLYEYCLKVIIVEGIVGEKRWGRSECGLVVLRPLTNDVVLSTEYVVDLRRGTPHLSLSLSATNSSFFLILFSSFKYIYVSYIYVQVQQISLSLLSYTHFAPFLFSVFCSNLCFIFLNNSTHITNQSLSCQCSTFHFSFSLFHFTTSFHNNVMLIRIFSYSLSSSGNCI